VCCLFSLVDLRSSQCQWQSVPGSTNEGTPFPGEPFTFPSFGNVGPPCIATLSLPGLTIGLLVWLFPTPVILNFPSTSNAPNASDVSTPPTNQPHVDLSPSSPVRSPSLSPSSPSEISKVSSQVDKKKKKQKEKKKKNQKETKPPTASGHVGSEQPTIVNHTGSVDKVDKSKMKNPKPKFPCRICKGDHFLRDFPGLPKVLEMWYSMSSAPAGHVGDTPSTSDIKVGKKNRTSNFLVCYAKVIITLTFSLVWMRLLIFWKRFNFQLVIIISLPTHH
jgi:hypothetical protein